MQRLSFFCITAVLLVVLCGAGTLSPSPAWADSIRLWTDLEYLVTDTTVKTKATGEKSDLKRTAFSQIYNLDLQKELLPALTLGVGGGYVDNSSTSKVDGNKTDRWDTALRPYIELQLDTPILSGVSGYRKNTLKSSNINTRASKRHTEEFNNNLRWRPVELPEVDLNFTHSKNYNKPTKLEEKIDRETDFYHLNSRYEYQNYKFKYIHTTTDSRNKVTGFDTLSHLDNGTVRYYNSFHQGKVTLNGSARIKYDQTKFSGSGDRLVPTTTNGNPFYNLDDPPPAISNNVGDFIYNQPLSNINLLQNGAPQLSFGLDFATADEVDTIYVELLPSDPNDPTNSQASPTEISTIANLYSWRVYSSDDQLTWALRSLTSVIYDEFENHFEISFADTKTPFVKIVVTPLPETILPGKEIRLSRLSSFRTLPPDTSKFTSTDWTTDIHLNWEMSDKTSTGYDFLYRQKTNTPFDDKRSLLSTGARLNHNFNRIFSGFMHGQRNEVRERNGPTRIGYTYSAALEGDYLETFNQNLIYSLTYSDDDDLGTNTTQSLLLRNNLDLYEGWSMTLDGGFSWLDPAERDSSNNTFVRIGSNIIPNRWMNFSLFYDSRWERSGGVQKRHEQSAQFVANWVPLTSLSMTADILISDNRGEINNTTTRQQYFISWSPLRDGSLNFTVAYGLSYDTESEDTSVLSPSLRWQINKNTSLTCDYSVGKREGDLEKGDFETLRLMLRMFYL